MLRLKIIQNKILPFKGFVAISLFGFLFTRDRRLINSRVYNHELIHLRQQIEWLFLPFFVLYLCEWLYYLIKHRDRLKAYHAISFEREAYAHDHDMMYLSSRKPYQNYRH